MIPLIILSISDCQLPIANFKSSIRQPRHSQGSPPQVQKPIGNRQLEIGNAVIVVRKP
jgi:hypothetical protein